MSYTIPHFTNPDDADALEREAAAHEQAKEESWQRSDTDGFLSQWASGISAQVARLQAQIVRDGGKSLFIGLYHGDRRVKARQVEGTWGYRTTHSWLLADDEAKTFGRKFIPVNGAYNPGRIQKRLGLVDRWEWAPACAVIQGRGRGLSGSAWAAEIPTGDKWGADATLATEFDADTPRFS